MKISKSTITLTITALLSLAAAPLQAWGNSAKAKGKTTYKSGDIVSGDTDDDLTGDETDSAKAKDEDDDEDDDND